MEPFACCWLASPKRLCQTLGKIVRVVSEPAVRGPQGSQEQPRRINRVFSNLVILVIAGGTLTAVALKKEFWPFSHFPMYSVTLDYRKPFKVYRIAGLIEKDGHVTELFLNTAEELTPLTRGKLMQTLGYAKTTYQGRVWGSYMEINDEFYQRKLRGLVKLFNRNLKKSQNPTSDTPLIGMRLYELEFPDKLPRAQFPDPTKIRLMAEWRDER
jgi:hypothetical protein